jgi:hypothetical protein
VPDCYSSPIRSLRIFKRQPDKREIEVGVDRSDLTETVRERAKDGWRHSAKSWLIGDLEAPGLLAGKATPSYPLSGVQEWILASRMEKRIRF